MKKTDKFSEIAKEFREIEEKHLPFTMHSDRFNSMSEDIHKIENNSLLNDENKKEKQVDLLTRMHIETSYILLGRIKKTKLAKYMCMILAIPVAVDFGFNISSDNKIWSIINSICLLIDIFLYMNLNNAIDKLKNEFVDLNKDFFQ